MFFDELFVVVVVVVVFCFVVVIVVVIERPVKGEGHTEVKALMTWETDLPSMSHITLRLKKLRKIQLSKLSGQKFG